jgi:hypothetical protein
MGSRPKRSTQRTGWRIAAFRPEMFATAGAYRPPQSRRNRYLLRCSNRERNVTHMKPIQAVCDTCKKTVEAKPLLSENELWAALNKGDEIEVMHLADDVHHTWKLTGQDKENLRKTRAAGAD